MQQKYENSNVENNRGTRKPDDFEMSVQGLSDKVFHLEFHGRMAHDIRVKLREKEKEVADVKVKLEGFEYEKLEKMDKFCETIWKLSKTNNLLDVFNKYLDMPKYERQNPVAFKVECDTSILQLENRIKDLESQLVKKKSILQSLDGEKLTLVKEIQVVRSHWDNHQEIICLKIGIEKYRRYIQSLRSKIAILKKKIPAQERFIRGPSSEDEKYDFRVASKLMEKKMQTTFIKRPKFSVKKESTISRKLSNKRNPK